MDETVTVIDARGDAGVLGHVRAEDVLYFDGHGAVLGDGATNLRRMLGQGYGRRQFHLMLPGVTLERCRVITPHMLFLYESVREFGAEGDDAPTHPEWTVADPDTCH